MNADGMSLDEILNGPYQYIIPVFQRYYSWTKTNWRKLWQDIGELQDPEQPSPTHFMGALVFVPLKQPKQGPKAVPKLQVIDGQQRLLTMTMLLCALRNVAVEYKHLAIAEEINTFFLMRPKAGNERLRVFPRQLDREQYGNAITREAPSADVIGECVVFFEGEIKKLPGANTEEALQDLLELLRSRLEFVGITLGDENPFQIFRSLNSTGVKLSEADLIRNFVFMNMDLDQQDAFDQQIWQPFERRFDYAKKKQGAELSSFFRFFLMKDGRYVPPAATFVSFEARYDGTGFDPITLVSELQQNTDFYDIIRGATQHHDNSVNQAFAKLRPLDSSTTNQLLMTLMQKNSQGTMSDADLAEAIELLAGFILRRLVCGESSRNYSRWFVSACSQLADEPLENLRAYLIGRGFPEDTRLERSMLLYNLYKSGYADAVLRALEGTHPHREPASLAQAQVEHIMPQTLTQAWRDALGSEAGRIHSDWLNTIGNLTLSAYNQHMGNKPFAEKSAIYNSSNIHITRAIAANYTAWGEREIQQRGAQLVQKAKEIWHGPNT